MKWHLIENGSDTVTSKAVDVGNGVILRETFSYDMNNACSISTCFIPGVNLVETDGTIQIQPKQTVG